MRWEQRALCGVLRRAPHIPRHVAFIMDGNRRYAKQQQVHTAQGHYRGYDKLKEVSTHTHAQEQEGSSCRSFAPLRLRQQRASSRLPLSHVC